MQLQQRQGNRMKITMPNREGKKLKDTTVFRRNLQTEGKIIKWSETKTLIIYSCGVHQICQVAKRPMSSLPVTPFQINPEKQGHNPS